MAACLFAGRPTYLLTVPPACLPSYLIVFVCLFIYWTRSLVHGRRGGAAVGGGGGDDGAAAAAACGGGAAAGVFGGGGGGVLNDGDDGAVVVVGNGTELDTDSLRLLLWICLLFRCLPVS